MNLKEAFQAQNKIADLLNFISRYLTRSENLMKVTEKHLKSKTLKGQEDEVVEVAKKDYNNYDIAKLLSIWQELIEEKARLQTAIVKAKTTMEFDIDGEVDSNKYRRNFIETLQVMVNKNNSSEPLKGEGMGYIVNNEGNPTNFRYDIERIETINYDRNKARSLLKQLTKKADEVSIKIDKALLETEVSYAPKFELIGETHFIIEELLER